MPTDTNQSQIAGVTVTTDVSISRIGWALLWIGSVASVLLLILRFVWFDGWWLLAVTNYYRPVAFAPCVVVVPLALWRGRKSLAAVALPGAIWCLLTLLSFVPSKAPVAVGESLRVVTANLLQENDEPSALLRELRALDADVLILQEVSAAWNARLRSHGFFRDYPHHVVEVGDYYGIALLSRVPTIETSIRWIRPPDTHAPMGNPCAFARIAHEGRAIDILGVHPSPPFNVRAAAAHLMQLGAIENWVRESDGPLVAAGDFNASEWSRFSTVLSDRMDDAWDLARSGWGPTWPNGRSWLPGIRLDHIYISKELTATRVFRGRGRGTDHRPVIADLAWRAE
ncbi:MAG: endonuclease/exonuclease/phosphatase family protein [Myxococcota bacterium]